jgi:hypothetical protein
MLILYPAVYLKVFIESKSSGGFFCFVFYLLVIFGGVYMLL